MPLVGGKVQPKKMQLGACRGHAEQEVGRKLISSCLVSVVWQEKNSDSIITETFWTTRRKKFHCSSYGL